MKDYRTRQCPDWRRSPPRRKSLPEFRVAAGRRPRMKTRPSLPSAAAGLRGPRAVRHLVSRFTDECLRRHGNSRPALVALRVSSPRCGSRQSPTRLHEVTGSVLEAGSPKAAVSRFVLSGVDTKFSQLHVLVRAPSDCVLALVRTTRLISASSMRRKAFRKYRAALKSAERPLRVRELSRIFNLLEAR